MSDLQDILSEYTRMRENGLETKPALQALRPPIEALDKAQRQELADLIRAWESRASQPASPPPQDKPDTPPAKTGGIRPLKGAAEAPPAEPPTSKAATGSPAEDVTWTACPNCGRPNQQHEVFCYACGQLLEPIQGEFATKHFDVGEKPASSEYFGQDSVLALRVRGSSTAFEVRPQVSDHEIIVGRSAGGSAIMPDIDLNTRQGADLGVSRVHLAVRYAPDQKALLVVDLGSANGTFINGQRVLPKEIRVLRHGDELRLGKLTLIVSFRHPGNAAG